jgi:hypothetical protein
MTPDDVAPLASEHHLQLFDSSKSLVDTVGSFLLAGFDRGEALLLAVTPQRRELLTKRLQESGVNVRDAMAANRLVVLDAVQTLGKFMRRDTADAIAFDEVVGSIVARLGAERRVCIYGEMVDVLAAAGKYKAAQQLEELWNGLGRRASFTLLCGYASGHFGDPKTAPHLNAICAAHSHLHRKKDDLLAEFLLDQRGLSSLRTAAVRS